MITANQQIKTRLSTVLIIYILWVIGNLCANSLFFMGDNYNTAFLQIGDVIYFVTITGAGILASYHYSKGWNYSLKTYERTNKNIILSIVLLIFVVVMGYFAMEEQLVHGFSLNYILGKSLWWNISPLINLIPTMIAYSLLWYCLVLRTFQTSFKSAIICKVLAVILTSFVYSIYHFTSVNEIFTLATILDEVLITFIISVVLAVYVMLTNNLIFLTIANLILNWFVFTPVTSFHTTGTKLVFSYLVVITLFIIYIALYRPNNQLKKE